jgi:hypothetical protein
MINTMNRKMTKLVEKSRVYKEEYAKAWAFNNKTAAKIMSTVMGEAWLIQNKDHEEKQVMQLWQGGEVGTNFTTATQSRARFNEINGTNI